MLKRIYLSPIGYIVTILQSLIAFIHKPFMVYGFYNHIQKKFMKLTRISSSVKIMSKKNLDLDNRIWIGHYSILDATNGIIIHEGVQTGPFVSVFSHSSHTSIRLLGKDYLETDTRIGYINDKVEIGEYSFIGTATTIFPGVTIGKGCLIYANSVITKSIPDYSIVGGSPAKIIGDIFEKDKKYFSDIFVQEHYFDQSLITKWITMNKKSCS